MDDLLIYPVDDEHLVYTVPIIGAMAKLKQFVDCIIKCHGEPQVHSAGFNCYPQKGFAVILLPLSHKVKVPTARGIDVDSAAYLTLIH